jgi:hypothetical protein
VPPPALIGHRRYQAASIQAPLRDRTDIKPDPIDAALRLRRPDASN